MRISTPNYTQTPNDLFDYWLPKLGEAELKVLLVIMRKTFGWHKVRDRISLSQLSEITGLLRETVIKAARSLQKKGVIIRKVVGKKGSQSTIYELVIQEDSNKSYQSVNPTTSDPLVGLNPLGLTDPQKKDSYSKEKTTTQAAAVSSEKQAKEKSNPKIYECLAEIDIPERDKSEITRRYDEQTVKDAIAWATSPETKITKTLVQAIKWACKERPEMPKTDEDIAIEHKAIAKSFDGLENRMCQLHALSKHCEIVFVGNGSPICLKYGEKDFKKKFSEAMRKTKLM